MMFSALLAIILVLSAVRLRASAPDINFFICASRSLRTQRCEASEGAAGALGLCFGEQAQLIFGAGDGPAARVLQQLQNASAATVTLQSASLPAQQDALQAVLEGRVPGRGPYHAYILNGLQTAAAVESGAAQDLSEVMLALGAAQGFTAGSGPAWRDSLLPAVRGVTATFGGRLVAVPAGSSAALLYYRRDLFAAAGLSAPRTWAEAVEAAALFNGTDLDDDGHANDWGICLWQQQESGTAAGSSNSGGCSATEGLALMAVLAPLVQTNGTSSGLYFDGGLALAAGGMRSVVPTPAWETALTILRDLSIYAPPPGLSPALGSSPAAVAAAADCTYQPLFSQGRCAMAISLSGQFKADSSSAGDGGSSSSSSSTSTGSVRGRMGAALLPGSDNVLDWPTNRLLPCDAGRCPHAVAYGTPELRGYGRRRLQQAGVGPGTAATPPTVTGGSGSSTASAPAAQSTAAVAGAQRLLVNQAPSAALGGGLGVYLDRRPGGAEQMAAYLLVAQALSLERSWELVASPLFPYGPTRIEHVSDSSGTMDTWLRYGYHPADLHDYLEASAAALASPNLATDLRSSGGAAAAWSQLLRHTLPLVANASLPLPEVVSASRAAYRSLFSVEALADMRLPYAASIRPLDIGAIAAEPRATPSPPAPAWRPGAAAGGSRSGGGGGGTGAGPSSAQQDGDAASKYLAEGLGVGLAGAAALLALGFASLVLLRTHRQRRMHALNTPSSVVISAPGVGAATTLVVTDIQDSTRLWELLPAAVMDAAIHVHHNCIRRGAAALQGYESGTEGDSFLLAFHTAQNALVFCLRVQEELVGLAWPEELLQVDVCRPVWVTDTLPAAATTGAAARLPALDGLEAAQEPHAGLAEEPGADQSGGAHTDAGAWDDAIGAASGHAAAAAGQAAGMKAVVSSGTPTAVSSPDTDPGAQEARGDSSAAAATKGSAFLRADVRATADGCGHLTSWERHMGSGAATTPTAADTTAAGEAAVMGVFGDDDMAAQACSAGSGDVATVEAAGGTPLRGPLMGHARSDLQRGSQPALQQAQQSAARVGMGRPRSASGAVHRGQGASGQGLVTRADAGGSGSGRRRHASAAELPVLADAPAAVVAGSAVAATAAGVVRGVGGGISTLFMSNRQRSCVGQLLSRRVRSTATLDQLDQLGLDIVAVTAATTANNAAAPPSAGTRSSARRSGAGTGRALAAGEGPPSAAPTLDAGVGPGQGPAAMRSPTLYSATLGSFVAAAAVLLENSSPSWARPSSRARALGSSPAAVVDAATAPSGGLGSGPGGGATARYRRGQTLVGLQQQQQRLGVFAVASEYALSGGWRAWSLGRRRSEGVKPAAAGGNGDSTGAAPSTPGLLLASIGGDDSGGQRNRALASSARLGACAPPRAADNVDQALASADGNSDGADSSFDELQGDIVVRLPGDPPHPLQRPHPHIRPAEDSPGARHIRDIAHAALGADGGGRAAPTPAADSAAGGQALLLKGLDTHQAAPASAILARSGNSSLTRHPATPASITFCPMSVDELDAGLGLEVWRDGAAVAGGAREPAVSSVTAAAAAAAHGHGHAAAARPGHRVLGAAVEIRHAAVPLAASSPFLPDSSIEGCGADVGRAVDALGTPGSSARALGGRHIAMAEDGLEQQDGALPSAAAAAVDEASRQAQRAYQPQPHRAQRGPQQLLLRGLRVRMGIHSGVFSSADVTYSARMTRMIYGGVPMATAKAVEGAAAGGMVVLSSATHSLITAGCAAGQPHVLVRATSRHSAPLGASARGGARSQVRRAAEPAYTAAHDSNGSGETVSGSWLAGGFQKLRAWFTRRLAVAPAAKPREARYRRVLSIADAAASTTALSPAAAAVALAAPRTADAGAVAEAMETSTISRSRSIMASAKGTQGAGGAGDAAEAAGTVPIGQVQAVFWHGGVHVLDEHLPELEIFMATTPQQVPRWAVLEPPAGAGGDSKFQLVAAGVLSAPVGPMYAAAVTVTGAGAIAAWNVDVWRGAAAALWREAAHMCSDLGGFLATTRDAATRPPDGFAALPAAAPSASRRLFHPGLRGSRNSRPSAVATGAASSLPGPSSLGDGAAGTDRMTPSLFLGSMPAGGAADGGVGVGGTSRKGMAAAVAEHQLLLAVFPSPVAAVQWAAGLLAYGLLANLPVALLLHEAGEEVWAHNGTATVTDEEHFFSSTSEAEDLLEIGHNSRDSDGGRGAIVQSGGGTPPRSSHGPFTAVAGPMPSTSPQLLQQRSSRVLSHSSRLARVVMERFSRASCDHPPLLASPVAGSSTAATAATAATATTAAAAAAAPSYPSPAGFAASPVASSSRRWLSSNGTGRWGAAAALRASQSRAHMSPLAGQASRNNSGRLPDALFLQQRGSNGTVVSSDVEAVGPSQEQQYQQGRLSLDGRRLERVRTAAAHAIAIPAGPHSRPQLAPGGGPHTIAERSATARGLEGRLHSRTRRSFVAHSVSSAHRRVNGDSDDLDTEICRSDAMTPQNMFLDGGSARSRGYLSSRHLTHSPHSFLERSGSNCHVGAFSMGTNAPAAASVLAGATAAEPGSSYGTGISGVGAGGGFGGAGRGGYGGMLQCVPLHSPGPTSWTASVGLGGGAGTEGGDGGGGGRREGGELSTGGEVSTGAYGHSAGGGTAGTPSASGQQDLDSRGGSRKGSALPATYGHTPATPLHHPLQPLQQMLLPSPGTGGSSAASPLLLPAAGGLVHLWGGPASLPRIADVGMLRGAGSPAAGAVPGVGVGVGLRDTATAPVTSQGPHSSAATAPTRASASPPTQSPPPWSLFARPDSRRAPPGPVSAGSAAPAGVHMAWNPLAAMPGAGSESVASLLAAQVRSMGGATAAGMAGPPALFTAPYSTPQPQTPEAARWGHADGPASASRAAADMEVAAVAFDARSSRATPSGALATFAGGFASAQGAWTSRGQHSRGLSERLHPLSLGGGAGLMPPPSLGPFMRASYGPAMTVELGGGGISGCGARTEQAPMGRAWTAAASPRSQDAAMQHGPQDGSQQLQRIIATQQQSAGLPRPLLGSPGSGVNAGVGFGRGAAMGPFSRPSLPAVANSSIGGMVRSGHSRPFVVHAPSFARSSLQRTQTAGPGLGHWWAGSGAPSGVVSTEGPATASGLPSAGPATVGSAAPLPSPGSAFLLMPAGSGAGASSHSRGMAKLGPRKTPLQTMVSPSVVPEALANEMLAGAGPVAVMPAWHAQLLNAASEASFHTTSGGGGVGSASRLAVLGGYAAGPASTPPGAMAVAASAVAPVSALASSRGGTSASAATHAATWGRSVGAQTAPLRATVHRSLLVPPHASGSDADAAAASGQTAVGPAGGEPAEHAEADNDHVEELDLEECGIHVGDDRTSAADERGSGDGDGVRTYRAAVAMRALRGMGVGTASGNDGGSRASSAGGLSDQPQASASATPAGTGSGVGGGGGGGSHAAARRGQLKVSMSTGNLAAMRTRGAAGQSAGARGFGQAGAARSDRDSRAAWQSAGGEAAAAGGEVTGARQTDMPDPARGEGAAAGTDLHASGALMRSPFVRCQRATEGGGESILSGSSISGMDSCRGISSQLMAAQLAYADPGRSSGGGVAGGADVISASGLASAAQISTDGGHSGAVKAHGTLQHQRPHYLVVVSGATQRASARYAPLSAAAGAQPAPVGGSPDAGPPATKTCLTARSPAAVMTSRSRSSPPPAGSDPAAGTGGLRGSGSSGPYDMAGLQPRAPSQQHTPSGMSSMLPPSRLSMSGKPARPPHTNALPALGPTPEEAPDPVRAVEAVGAGGMKTPGVAGAGHGLAGSGATDRAPTGLEVVTVRPSASWYSPEPVAATAAAAGAGAHARDGGPGAEAEAGISTDGEQLSGDDLDTRSTVPVFPPDVSQDGSPLGMSPPPGLKLVSSIRQAVASPALGGAGAGSGAVLGLTAAAAAPHAAQHQQHQNQQQQQRPPHTPQQQHDSDRISRAASSQPRSSSRWWDVEAEAAAEETAVAASRLALPLDALRELLCRGLRLRAGVAEGQTAVEIDNAFGNARYSGPAITAATSLAAASINGHVLVSAATAEAAMGIAAAAAVASGLTEEQHFAYVAATAAAATGGAALRPSAITATAERVSNSGTGILGASVGLHPALAARVHVQPLVQQQALQPQLAAVPEDAPQHLTPHGSHADKQSRMPRVSPLKAWRTLRRNAAQQRQQAKEVTERKLAAAAGAAGAATAAACQ